MLQARVIPCLLLKDKGLVKTIQFKNPNYIGDPINAVWIFNQKEVDELIFLDIMATREKKKSSFELITKISDEAYMPLTIGGGIRSINDIKDVFYAGAEKVSINTAAIENPEMIKEASKTFGSQSIILSIDVKKNWLNKYEIYTYGGTKNTHIDPIVFSNRMEQLGVGEILVNSIDLDGTMNGYDIPLIRSIADSVSVPVIASGGAGKIDDFQNVIYEGHASAAAAGSLFIYHGRRKAVLINYPSKNDLEFVLKKPM